jgi:hypothetical protein
MNHDSENITPNEFTDDKYKVLISFWLESSIMSKYWGFDSEKYLSIEIVTADINDYYAGQKAMDFVEGNLKQLIPEINELNDFRNHAIKLPKDRRITNTDEITLKEYTVHEVNPMSSLKPSKDFLKKYKNKIVEVSVKTISCFLKDNPTKTFYGFSFDCSAEYGSLQLAMNTETDFKISAQRYVEEWNYSSEDLVRLKLSTGDWKYQGFNHDYPYWSELREFEIEIDDYVFSNSTEPEEAEEFVEEVLNMFAKAFSEIIQSDIFATIPKEKEFILQVLDHDENPEDSDERLSKLGIDPILISSYEK